MKERSEHLSEKANMSIDNAIAYNCLTALDGPMISLLGSYMATRAIQDDKARKEAVLSWIYSQPVSDVLNTIGQIKSLKGMYNRIDTIVEEWEPLDPSFFEEAI